MDMMCLVFACWSCVVNPFTSFEAYFHVHVLFRNWPISVFMEKANLVPVFKNGDKQLLKNHRPISVLSITVKIFERLLYNQMFEFFIRSDLICQNQSGFKPCDFCINQLLAITHEIYNSFDACLDVRVVF